MLHCCGFSVTGILFYHELGSIFCPCQVISIKKNTRRPILPAEVAELTGDPTSWEQPELRAVAVSHPDSAFLELLTQPQPFL